MGTGLTLPTRLETNARAEHHTLAAAARDDSPRDGIAGRWA